MPHSSDNPSITFCGLRIYAARDGTRVTGRVDFPCDGCGRSSIPIDYHSRRPPPEPRSSARAGNPEPRGSAGNPEPRGSARADKSPVRRELVERWRKLCSEHPERSATAIAADVAASAEIKCSPSSLRVWARKLDTEGPEGLCDRYIKPPVKVPVFKAAQARDALLLCAWWAYRIGNITKIDTGVMATAVGLIAAGYGIADLIATVDCYYAYKCDRAKYPFKPFSRWAKYDMIKWVERAAADADYARALGCKVQPARTPDCKTRRRNVRNRPTHQAIKGLAALPEPRGSVRAATRPENNTPDRDRLSAIDAARFAARMDQPETARRIAARIDTGIPALVANEDPQTVAESLAVLEDAYRVMLLKAAQGCREARDQALATLALWWDRMPQRIRNNIDFQVDAWRRSHPGLLDFAAQADLRRLLMLLPYLRDHRCGAQQLAVAARLPA